MSGGKKLIDLTGQRFTRLFVLGISHREWKTSSRGYRYFWRCRCDCGAECVQRRDTLMNGRVKSCGCWSADRVTTHGESGCGPRPSKEWRTWRGMKDRCLSPVNKDFHKYGGRGIKVWPGWVNDYDAFLAHVGRAPSSRHVIDRIDVNGNYEPGNRCAERAHLLIRRNRAVLR